MIDLRIVPAIPLHAGSVARRLAPEERERAWGAGIDPRRKLRGYIRDSFYVRAALLDGYAVALWGLKSGLLASEALVWLVVTPEARRHVVTAGRLALRELREMLGEGYELRSFVPAGDRGGRRFLDFLGFEPIGLEDGWLKVARRA